MEEILIVEDDLDIAHLISMALESEGLSSCIAPTAEAALAFLGKKTFSVCVLDLMLPGIDGLSLLKTIRSMRAFDSMPVIIASAKDDDSDIVSGLELGADDYISKPFSPKVLAARLRALIRRSSPQVPLVAGAKPSHYTRGGISLDSLRHSVHVGEKQVEFSATEFAILELLMSQPGRVFTREQIINIVKGPDYPVTDRAIDVHILSIRRKMESFEKLIETVRGVGYRFKEDQ
jgi:two-component system phosphate regulon response regulator PhoB